MNTLAIERLEALATPAMALAGIIIACAQLRLADLRLTHDLFDRRYAIYLEKLGIRAAKAAELNDKIGINVSPAEIQDRTDLVNWFSSQIDSLTENFKPFLQFEQPWWQRYVPIAIITWLPLALLSYLLLIDERAENPSPQTTVTEVFHRRCECAALGEKTPTSSTIAPGITIWPISHYDPRTNRCYVVVNSVDAARPFTPPSRRCLFDSQTGEVLAYTEVKESPAQESRLRRRR